MLKIEIKTIYYYKKKFHHETIKEKKAFPAIQDGLDFFNNYELKYYSNEKDFSSYEELSIYQPTEYGIKRYYKKVDPITYDVETNYIIKD